MINGNSLSLKDKADEISKWVNDLFSQEVWGYIRMDREALRKLTQQECSEIGYILSSQSMDIQMRANKIASCMKWTKHHIDTMIASTLNNYDKFKPYEERRLLATKDNDVAIKMLSQLSELEQKKEALEFLAQRVDNLAKYLIEVRRAKYEPSPN